jgi:hypothetical protein
VGILAEDPEEWISRLEIMSQEMLALVDVKYEKRDQDIIAHTFAHLPKVYESTIDALRDSNGKRNTLEEVKKGLTTKWKAIYGKNNKGKPKIEEVLKIETKKNTYKKKFPNLQEAGAQGG